MKRILGCDQSLTSFGVAWYTVGEAPAPVTGQNLPPWRSCETWKPPAKLGKGPARLLWIKNKLVNEITLGVDLIVLEGRAPKGISDALLLGGLFAVLEVTAAEREISVLIVPPASRIAYMSCGNASTRDGTDNLKAMSISLAIQELDAAEDINDDEADAMHLAEIGAHYFGLKNDDDPKRQEVIANLRLTPEARKIVEQDRKIAEADRIKAARNKPAKTRKSKQLDLFEVAPGERIFSGPGPVPAREIGNG